MSDRNVLYQPPIFWETNDHILYIQLLKLFEAVDNPPIITAWKWARLIVNTNKWNKENTDEAKRSD